ncbi:MAG TPA: hypothetical protein VFQ13_09425 [Anaerolineales bacterium]|nr:hypothetical protein [Anaerolineales bacterium]
MQNQSNIKLNDIPFGSWLIGFILLGTGIYFFSFQGFALNTILFGGIGLLFLLLSRGLTITADKNTRILRLHYWSLYFWRTTKEIPFDEIETIRVDSVRSTSHSRGHGQTRHRGRSYRVEVVRKDGSIVPFRMAYSSGSYSKQKIADQLRAFLGLGEAFDESPMGAYRAANKIVSEMASRQQEALSGPNEQERITNGVHWTLQSTSLGMSPVTRWYSPDFKTRGGFLFLAQKVAGQSTGGFIAAIGKALFQQSISMYGFKGDDVPNVSQAEMLASVSPQLDAHFMAFTNIQAEAQQILNPWMQRPLADWGERYPLKQFQAKGGVAQLVVLFSPNGVYLATMGVLQPEQVEELAALGVEMVKTQGVTQGT